MDIFMIKTKLFLCLSGFLCFFLSFFAHAGFYFGAGLGPDEVNFKQFSQTYKPAPASFNVINKTSLSGIGLFGSVFGGYDCLYHQAYFAAEANSKISSMAFNTSNNEYVNHNFINTKYKIDHSVTISLFSGYLVTPSTLFYGRIGYTNGKMTISTTDASLDNISHRRDGAQAGLGIRQDLTNNLSIRIDVSYGQYNKTSLHSFDHVNSVTKNTQILPRQQLVEFAVIHHLG